MLSLWQKGFGRAGIKRPPVGPPGPSLGPTPSSAIIPRILGGTVSGAGPSGKGRSTPILADPNNKALAVVISSVNLKPTSSSGIITDVRLTAPTEVFTFLAAFNDVIRDMRHEIFYFVQPTVSAGRGITVTYTGTGGGGNYGFQYAFHEFFDSNIATPFGSVVTAGGDDTVNICQVSIPAEINDLLFAIIGSQIDHTRDVNGSQVELFDQETNEAPLPAASEIGGASSVKTSPSTGNEIMEWTDATDVGNADWGMMGVAMKRSIL